MHEFKEDLVKLTEFQKEYLINEFFKHSSSPIWEEVANTLLEKGSCIVPGNGYIWRGGIGGFIEFSKVSNAVDCTLLTFNLKNFLKTEYFKDRQTHAVKFLLTEIETSSKKHSELRAL
jgi:hypothetical protein